MLAVKLREGTHEAHKQAESNRFVSRFLEGDIQRDEFAQLVAAHYYIYYAMEAVHKNLSEHPLLKSLYFPELLRQQALEADLKFLFGDTWSSKIQPSPATQTYQKRFEFIEQNAPELLVAHLYTRYLGDLSGGQQLKAVARRALSLTSEEGLSFYEFSEIPKRAEFKDQYRTALNELPLQDGQLELIVEEAKLAFKLNGDIMAELDNRA